MTISVGTKRLSIFERDKFLCQYCGKFLTLEQCSIDHHVSRSKRGTNDSSNLFTCCASCNSSKGPRNIESFRMICRVKKSPYSEIIKGHAVKKLMDLGVEFPLLEEHIFFYEKKESN